MNIHIQPTSPPPIKDPRIKRELQLAGLRFAIVRANWFVEECRHLGTALKEGKITPEQADERLGEIGALDLVYGRGP
jgi:hypothetical protein